MAGSIFLKMSHGYSIETEREDPLVHMVETAAKEFYVATGPGAWYVISSFPIILSSILTSRHRLVDTIPWLKDLPDWLPGQGFKKVAARFRATNMEQADRPHEWVKRQVVRINQILSNHENTDTCASRKPALQCLPSPLVCSKMI